jgi:hypothetical protein
MNDEIGIRVHSPFVCVLRTELVRCANFKDLKQNSLREEAHAQEEHRNRRRGGGGLESQGNNILSGTNVWIKCGN